MNPGPIHDMLVWLAHGAGLGYLPLLPGTGGALAGVALSVGLARLRVHWRMMVIAMLVGAAVPVCDHGARAHGGSDHPSIVADELLTFPVATAALPIRHNPMLLASAFVISRLLDGWKPPPAPSVARLKGGAGIVFDDLVTNLWTLLLCAAGWRALRRSFSA